MICRVSYMVRVWWVFAARDGSTGTILTRDRRSFVKIELGSSNARIRRIRRLRFRFCERERLAWTKAARSRGRSYRWISRAKASVRFKVKISKRKITPDVLSYPDNILFFIAFASYLENVWLYGKFHGSIEALIWLNLCVSKFDTAAIPSLDVYSNIRRVALIHARIAIDGYFFGENLCQNVT